VLTSDWAPVEPAASVEIRVGQTPDQVVAALGEPTKKVKTGNREIYYYEDMKLVFVGGRVKDIQ
jgi:outer membrane protein assembly factor BamE (lipoprotein component of BamABCDE complex)